MVIGIHQQSPHWRVCHPACSTKLLLAFTQLSSPTLDSLKLQLSKLRIG